jgi:hypothetical protein
MKTKTIITNIAIALSLGIVYTGCKKDKDNEATPSTTTTSTTSTTSTESANSIAESSYTEIFKSISQISESNAGLRSSCATITIDTTPFLSFPKTVTIDYGTGAGCSGKTGKLTAIFTGKYGAFGTVITITADSNYTINSHKIHVGTHTITSGLSNNTSGNKTFNLSVVGGSVGLSVGSVSWNSTRTITWIAGDSTTLDPTDDVYQITGTSSGTNMNGDVFTSTISTPLIVANNCPWIESGVITITTFNKKTRSIDFGSGACDNKATVTIDTTTYNINL